MTGLRSIGEYNARFGNYRYAQPMNGRVVEANFQQPESTAIRPSPDGDILQSPTSSRSTSRNQLPSPESEMFRMSAPTIRTSFSTGTSARGSVRRPARIRVRLPSVRERVIGMGRPILKRYITGKMAPLLYKVLNLKRNLRRPYPKFRYYLK